MTAKYDSIGGAYNETRKADKGITRILVDMLDLNSGDTLLDIGCGTGNYSIAVWRPDITLTGVDPSELMLEAAKLKNQDIHWVMGMVEDLPFDNESFTKILATLTVHHWADLKKGFQEAFRILRPGAKMVLFTSTSEQMEGYWLNHYFPKMLRNSIEQMPAREILLNVATDAGFQIKKTRPWSIPANLEDKFLYCGKNNPELYFDATVRNGISSFRALANRQEVENGLAELRKDIDTGKWADISMKYNYQEGDYLFLMLSK